MLAIKGQGQNENSLQDIIGKWEYLVQMFPLGEEALNYLKDIRES